MGLKGFKVMLMGASGTGKTHSIGTLVDAGQKVFVVMMENGLESLIGYWADQGKPIPPNLQWKVISQPSTGFAALADQAKKIGILQADALAKMVDNSRSGRNYYESMLGTLSNFVSDRDGKSYGKVEDWATDCTLVFDGLTGICDAAMYTVIGNKPMRSQQDWGMAQDIVYRFIDTLVNSCDCHCVLLAHIERETDPVLGGVKLMASALGKALAPKLSAKFSDVVLSSRTGTKWTWDTLNPQADLKTRNLPLRADLEPDFKAVLKRWSARADVMSQAGAVAIDKLA